MVTFTKFQICKEGGGKRAEGQTKSGRGKKKKKKKKEKRKTASEKREGENTLQQWRDGGRGGVQESHLNTLFPEYQHPKSAFPLEQERVEEKGGKLQKYVSDRSINRGVLYLPLAFLSHY